MEKLSDEDSKRRVVSFSSCFVAPPEKDKLVIFPTSNNKKKFLLKPYIFLANLTRIKLLTTMVE